MAYYTANRAEDDPVFKTRRGELIEILSGNKRPLPAEITLVILEYAGYIPRRIRPKIRQRAPEEGAHPASVPPPCGASPFMTSLDPDLRRMILLYSLPTKEKEFKPVCADRDSPKLENHTPAPNRGSDLMTLNKTLKHEVARVLYEERVFAVHIHQGVKHGGIECITSGRQPLQYKTDDDMRFDRFKGIEEFGFHRLKKLHVTIFHEAASEVAHRHIALNTYYMNLAMCLLLKRDTSGDFLDSKRITYISIDFATGDKDNGDPFSWVDSTGQPRITSIHGCSDVELVLRPFAVLTGVHNVHVKLPDDLDQHASTGMFVNNLVASMMSLSGGMFNTDDLDHKIETAKEALHDYVLKQLGGCKDHYDIDITEDELMEDAYDPDADHFDSDYEIDDSYADPRSQDFSGWLGKMDDEQEELTRAAKEAESAVDQEDADRAATEELIVLFELKQNPYGSDDYFSNKPADVSGKWTSKDEDKLLELKAKMGAHCFNWVGENLYKLKIKKAMGFAINYKDAFDNNPLNMLGLKKGKMPIQLEDDSAMRTPGKATKQDVVGTAHTIHKPDGSYNVARSYQAIAQQINLPDARRDYEGEEDDDVAAIVTKTSSGSWSLVTEKESDPFEEV